eukprot:ANDGO_07223.mRNA.1 hypothetical protein
MEAAGPIIHVIVPLDGQAGIAIPLCRVIVPQHVSITEPALVMVVASATAAGAVRDATSLWCKPRTSPALLRSTARRTVRVLPTEVAFAMMAGAVRDATSLWCKPRMSRALLWPTARRTVHVLPTEVAFAMTAGAVQDAVSQHCRPGTIHASRTVLVQVMDLARITTLVSVTLDGRVSVAT